MVFTRFILAFERCSSVVAAWLNVSTSGWAWASPLPVRQSRYVRRRLSVLFASLAERTVSARKNRSASPSADSIRRILPSSLALALSSIPPYLALRPRLMCRDEGGAEEEPPEGSIGPTFPRGAMSGHVGWALRAQRWV